jgi:serine phosphatase RsbU (regulator of sigma subunit)
VIMTKMNRELIMKREEISAQNEEIIQQNEEIEAHRDHLEVVNNELEKTNRRITESIEYAKNIQESLLPADKQFKEIFPESFVFFLPKDIVSGDFYWLHKIKNKIYIAVADCTGHGVPGAFMSMLGYSLLNEIISSEPDIYPGEILTLLDTRIRRSLSRNMDSPRDDGMEISLCLIDTEKNEVRVACTNQTIIYFDQGKLQLFQGDAFSLGGTFGYHSGNIFTEHFFIPTPDTTIYLFTDGFTDQFGYDSKSKFMFNAFRDLIAGAYKQNMPDQLKLFSETFNNWKGAGKQIDDVLVIGFNPVISKIS